MSRPVYSPITTGSIIIGFACAIDFDRLYGPTGVTRYLAFVAIASLFGGTWAHFVQPSKPRQ